MFPRRGFTWTELLVLLVVLALVAALLIPTITGARGRDQRVRCAANLRLIGQAILLYSNDNRGAYPRTRTSAGPVRVPTWGTGAAATQPFSDDNANAPADNDVTAALFLLLRTQAIAARAFVCPASPAAPDTFNGLTPQQRSNFSDIQKNLSYSYANPFPDQASMERSHTLNLIRRFAGSEFVYIGDRNPGLADRNSPNHNGTGQNVFYGDGHVVWCESRKVGVNGDDIYLNADGKLIASPVDVNDSLLLPPDRDQ